MSWSMTKKQRLAYFFHFGLFPAQFQDRQAILMRYCCLIVKIETTGQEKRWISKFCVFWSWFRYIGRGIEAWLAQMFHHLRANCSTSFSENVSLYDYIPTYDTIPIDFVLQGYFVSGFGGRGGGWGGVSCFYGNKRKIRWFHRNKP